MIPEILDKILGLLHSDSDYTSLETCSIVFPQFVDRHLYSQITLDIVGGPRGLISILPLDDIFYHTYQRTYYIVDTTDFLRMLADRPHVANYVRLVQIIIGDTRSFFPQELSNRLSLTSSILSILPHPESIMVGAHKTRTMSWHTLGAEFSTAFRNSVRLPSVKSIAIFNMRHLSLDNFDGCENLENLILNDTFLQGGSVSTPPYPRLRSLHLVHYESFTRVVSWLQKSNTLHTLSLRLFSNSIPNFFTLIEACSTSLVNLDINHNYFYGGKL
jgi:hypothetical protein